MLSISPWRQSLFCTLIALASLAVAAEGDRSQPEASAEARPGELLVALKPAPPFVMQAEDGVWRGYSVELLEAVAKRLERRPVYTEYDLQGLLDACAQGRAQVGVGALTVTSEREAQLDFSHPYYITGLGIAVRQGGSWMRGMLALLSWGFVQAVGALCLVLLLAAFAVWLFERRRNAEQFGGSAGEGLGAAFWWSAVTMTTVGYGDKAPKTLGGRIVGLLWMFISVIIVSSFTASIASSLTVGNLQNDIQGPDDLKHARVAVVEHSNADTVGTNHGYALLRYPDLAAACQAVLDEEADAVVNDRPLLGHVIHGQAIDLHLLPQHLLRQDYAFVLPPDSELRESFNRILIQLIDDGTVEAIRRRYLQD